MTDRLEPAPAYRGRVLDAQLHLLDRQILDSEDTPVATVDDLELEGAELGGFQVDRTPPRLTALLSGNVLGTRIFGGRPPTSRLHRIDAALVSDVGVVIRIAALAERFDITWVERWLRDHVIARIPGGRHDPR
ncbi:MAG: hypothetical protein QOC55_2464 [Thermoleophilaceae bacterium]|jgi:hypothetical protein|nr:hypothetical protein [Thermoleophilaceae bacterium]